jgi:hypothetical protein
MFAITAGLEVLLKKTPLIAMYPGLNDKDTIETGFKNPQPSGPLSSN